MDLLGLGINLINLKRIRRANTLLLMSQRSTTLITANITNNSITINVSNLRSAETIKFLTAHSVKVDWESESDEEAAEWYGHGDVVTALVSEKTCERWEESTTADGGDDPR